MYVHCTLWATEARCTLAVLREILAISAHGPERWLEVAELTTSLYCYRHLALNPQHVLPVWLDQSQLVVPTSQP